MNIWSLVYFSSDKLYAYPAIILLSSAYLSSVVCADDVALTRLLQTSFLVVLPVLVVFGSFFLQVLFDIANPDSSGKSFLVSCQTVSFLSW